MTANAEGDVARSLADLAGAELAQAVVAIVDDPMSSESALLAVVAHPSVTPRMLEPLLLRETLSLPLQTTLAMHPTVGVRRRLAWSPSPLAAATIEALAAADPVTRSWVGERTDVPAHVFTALAADVNHDVRIAVAENPVTPPAVLVGLLTDPQVSIRQTVLANPSLPPTAAQCCLHDPDLGVRELAQAVVPDAPAAALQAILASGPDLVAVLLGRHSATCCWEPADYAPFLAVSHADVRLAALRALSMTHERPGTSTGTPSPVPPR